MGEPKLTHKPQSLGLRLQRFLLNVFVIEVDRVTLARREPLRRLAPVDVIAQEHVQNVARLPARAGQIHDRRIVNRELRDLPLQTSVDGELLLIGLAPEVRVVGQQASEHEEKLTAHMDGALAVLNATDAEALVDQVEEGLHVLAHVRDADDVAGLVESRNELIDVDVAAGSLVRMQDAGDLRHGQGRDQLASGHALAPGNAPMENEGLVVLAQARKGQNSATGLTTIAQKDVRGHLGAQCVENPEAVTLPLLRCVEMDQRSDTDRSAGVAVQEVDGRTGTLKTVNDVRRILQPDVAVFVETVLLTAHAEFDIRQLLATLQRREDAGLARQRRDFTLVVVDPQVNERLRRNDAAQDDVAVVLVQGPVEDLDRLVTVVTILH